MRKHFIQFQKNDSLRKRLFCFPYAGTGAAIYRSWLPFLPSDIELVAVELPGRVHLKEKIPGNMQELIDVLYPEILSSLDYPFAFFGHSFGSIVAYALTRRLMEDNQKLPFHLFVSSRRAPHIPSPFLLGHLNDQEFLTEIQIFYGAIHAAVLNDQALLSLFLPILKEDIKINETYISPCSPPLSLPVTVYYGLEDHSGSYQSLKDWEKVTIGPFTLKSFPGKHFYIDTQRKELIEEICQQMRLQRNH